MRTVPLTVQLPATSGAFAVAQSLGLGSGEIAVEGDADPDLVDGEVGGGRFDKPVAFRS